MMHWYGNGMDGWGYALMTVNMLLFWGLVVGGIVVLVRYLAGSGRAQQGADSGPFSRKASSGGHRRR
jgi:putative membrane protein